jgi:hypothetical protein
MPRILKVFVTGDEQEALAGQARIVERYPGFVVVEVPDETSEELSRSYLAQDITEQYLIPGNRQIDTARPRLDAGGTVQTHPAYADAAQLPRGRHHYLVQFVGHLHDHEPGIPLDDPSLTGQRLLLVAGYEYLEDPGHHATPPKPTGRARGRRTHIYDDS